MTTDEYDQLLEDIRKAQILHRNAVDRVIITEGVLHELLSALDEEEHRIAQQALAHMPIASRKLVVGE